MGILISTKIYQMFSPGSDMGRYLAYWCPGCDCAHALPVEKPNHLKAMWKFNGNYIKPSFHPSVDVWRDSKESRCHSWVRDGEIDFLNDSGSKHPLRGYKVPIPDWPLDEVDDVD